MTEKDIQLAKLVANTILAGPASGDPSEVVARALVDGDLSAAAQDAVSKRHTRAHAIASADDHSDWPAGLDATELGYVNGVTSAIQTQLNAKSASKKRVSYFKFTCVSGGTFTDAAYNTSNVPPFTNRWLYDADQWDNIAVYFVADVFSSASDKTVSVALLNSAYAQVTDSEVTTVATTRTRLVSSNIVANLVDEGVYHVVNKVTSGGTGTRNEYGLMIVQSG